MYTNQDQSLETKVVAHGLANKMGQLEIAIMAVSWHTILERFNATSLTIQGIEIDRFPHPPQCSGNCFMCTLYAYGHMFHHMHVYRLFIRNTMGFSKFGLQIFLACLWLTKTLVAPHTFAQDDRSIGSILYQPSRNLVPRGHGLHRKFKGACSNGIKRYLYCS